MLYLSTKTLLSSIVQQLETTEGEWDDHIESGKECLYEMYQMLTPGVASSIDHLAVRKIGRAIPHVKSMLGSIRRGDRITAIEQGKAAIAQL
jgi:hypothetical protein